MTIQRAKFYGGYLKLQVGDATVRSHYLSATSPRFIRFVCFKNEDTIYLPDSTRLPIHSGGASFVLWNEGYNNCLIKDFEGSLVGCIQGNGAAGVNPCDTHVHLVQSVAVEGALTNGVWHMDCYTCCEPDLTQTETWTESDSDTGTFSWSNSEEETEYTGHAYSQIAKEVPQPLPFPRHPEIPIPQRRPQRVAEGI